MKTAIRLWGIFRLLIHILAALGTYLMWRYALTLMGVPMVLVWLVSSFLATWTFLILQLRGGTHIPKWFAHYRVQVNTECGHDEYFYILRIRMLLGLISWQVAQGNSLEELRKTIEDGK